MDFSVIGKQLLATVIFSGLGLIVMGVAFWLWELITPYSIRKEVADKQNVAVAVIMAGMLIGISIIIAAALQG